jgi:hypothetical protein
MTGGDGTRYGPVSLSFGVASNGPCSRLQRLLSLPCPAFGVCSGFCGLMPGRNGRDARCRCGLRELAVCLCVLVGHLPPTRPSNAFAVASQCLRGVSGGTSPPLKMSLCQPLPTTYLVITKPPTTSSSTLPYQSFNFRLVRRRASTLMTGWPSGCKLQTYTRSNVPTTLMYGNGW